MKRLLFFLIITFASPLLADDLPVLWLEAGKENEFQTVVPGPQTIDWSLRFEHRVLDQGKAHETTYTQAMGHRILKIKTPPLKPGVMLNAQLLIGDAPYRNVVIAPSDPFEDRETWFAEHPIALYDPNKTTIELFEEEEIPFKRLGSFAEIEAVENAVIVIGQGVDFEREKGLSELLFQKAADGGTVLVATPSGDIPLDYPPTIYSLTLNAEAKYLFPLASGRMGGGKWTLQTKDDQLFLVVYTDSRFKMITLGASLLDIRFADTRKGWEAVSTQSFGRIIIDKELRFFNNVESRWYFKSLIETLTESLTRSQP